MGLKLEEENLSARESRLRMRLINVKKILVILDDVWSRLDLEELEISYGTHMKDAKSCNHPESEMSALQKNSNS